MSIETMFRLDGRTAFVTGASGGIGAHLAGVLAQAGAAVVLAARRQAKLDDLAAKLVPSGAEVITRTLDVTDEASVRRCFDSLSVIPDIIVNNAGITNSAPILEQTTEAWDAVMSTDLRGVWLVAQQAARRLVAAERPGSIINVASILGARVSGHVAPYSAAKAAVIQLTRSLALELARYRITANSLLPGYVLTDLNREFLESEAGQRLKARIPSRRFATLDDLNGAVLLLASAAGTHITGAEIAVDGGHLVSPL